MTEAQKRMMDKLGLTEEDFGVKSTPASPAEQREQAYNTDAIIEWGGSLLTVTQAAQQWAYYAAEGRTDKTEALTTLISAAKQAIRAQYPDT